MLLPRLHPRPCHPASAFSSAALGAPHTSNVLDFMCDLCCPPSNSPPPPCYIAVCTCSFLVCTHDHVTLPLLSLLLLWAPLTRAPALVHCTAYWHAISALSSSSLVRTETRGLCCRVLLTSFSLCIISFSTSLLFPLRAPTHSAIQ
jgi:hypothetical protein